jgi:branched-chain amino acid transport system permease protein
MTTLWSGLTTGAIYALVASGYNLVLVSSGVLNFAQGAIVMFGGFMGYFATSTLKLPAALAILFGIVIGFGVGLLSELLAVRPLRWATHGRPGGHGELVTTVGFATALTGLAGIIWGFNALPVNFPGANNAIDALGGRLYPLQFAIIGTAVVVGVGLHFWTTRTRWGLASLAVAEDREAASARGINVTFLSLLSFAMAGALGGGVGVLTAPVTFASTDLGNLLALSGFVAIAIGGLGSHLGSTLGGFVIGVAGAFAARYLGASYQDISVFALLLVTLMLRPGGLGSRVQVRNV